MTLGVFLALFWLSLWSWALFLSMIKGGHYIVACTSTRDRGQDLDPSNNRVWPLDTTENLALTPDYPALTTPIDRPKSFDRFSSCPRFLPWPFDQLQNLTTVAGRLCGVPRYDEHASYDDHMAIVTEMLTNGQTDTRYSDFTPFVEV